MQIGRLALHVSDDEAEENDIRAWKETSSFKAMQVKQCHLQPTTADAYWFKKTSFTRSWSTF